jgi:hypothetical protein
LSLLVNPDVLFVIRLAYVLIAGTGIAISAYVGWDSHRDLVALRRLGQNGRLELIGVINRRDALRVNGPLHVVFFTLGVFTLLVSHPQTFQAIASGEFFAVLFGAIQGSAVVAQIQNQIGRARNRMREEL